MDKKQIDHQNTVSKNQTSRILYGTAGWSYADWEGTVYPLPKEQGFNPLIFLSRDFQFVEVNTTFYHIPSLKLTSGWVRKTEAIPDFRFWIKIFQNFTHKRKTSKPEIDAFINSLNPLNQAGKLAGLLAQFPYSFKLSTQNLEYLQQLHTPFQSFPFAVEFRHNSWNQDDIFDFLKEKKIIWVNIDQPVISQSLPLTAELTHPHLSYFRLHGRNYKSWFSGQGRNARYDYDYKAQELNIIADKIKKLAKMARQIFVSGNNHYKGQAIKNLKELKDILKKKE
jgi:uncharacterized protein YecE (DUF72 family)